jgi:uncharacterized protein YigA (DUF484 family)
MSDNSDSNDLTSEQVNQYLRDNPEFFQSQPQLLQSLKLPHESGKAISLIEKQVSVLRDRNVELRHRLGHLIDNARENDVLFDKTRRLVLGLLEAEDLGDLVDALLYSFDSDFQVQYTSLILFSANQPEGVGPVRMISLKDAKKSLPRFTRLSKTLCGQFSAEDTQELFPKDHPHIGSCAVTPLSNGYPLGILAIANSNPDYYRSSMGTLFLNYIGEVLNRCLPRLLP